MVTVLISVWRSRLASPVAWMLKISRQEAARVASSVGTKGVRLRGRRRSFSGHGALAWGSAKSSTRKGGGAATAAWLKLELRQRSCVSR